MAFATVSRGIEIASLGVEDVAQDGSWVRVRPKTWAATWRRLLKRVDNAPGLPVRDILKTYRSRALRRGSSLLWGAGERASGVWGTDAISRALAGAARALGFKQRVSAHSGRKGAAIEALFAGAPLPVIQAFGDGRVSTLFNPAWQKVLEGPLLSSRSCWETEERISRRRRMQTQGGMKFITD